jgi:hypothetical protein
MGKPAARRGRKASGLTVDDQQIAGLPVEVISIVSTAAIRGHRSLRPGTEDLESGMANNHWRVGILAFAGSMALSACNLGNSSGTNANEATPGANTQGGPNTAPTIAGIPSANATAGATYLFQPNAADVDGDALTFTATGLPTWATLNRQTGVISGTPTTGNAGTSTPITLAVSDGEGTASLPSFTITVSSSTTPPSTPPATNVAPTISGAPSATSQVNAAYNFAPSASDANGDALGFSITGKPIWASFSTATGALTGTPTAAQVGTYANIVITVSDGKLSQTLPAFTITVATATGTGTATLSWTAPTQNTDGTQLTNLSGYKVYHGTSSAALTDVRTVAANSSSYQFAALTSGTHYFAISAYNSDGAESSLSVVGSKTVQ